MKFFISIVLLFGFILILSDMNSMSSSLDAISSNAVNSDQHLTEIRDCQASQSHNMKCNLLYTD
jgi:hypothetical protein